MKKNISVTFHSTCVEVTGSCRIITISFPDFTSKNILVDCGSFMETKYNYLNANLPNILPQNIDFVFITHDHTDHDGRLPMLVKNGYSGNIYSTLETKELMFETLMDSFGIQKRAKRAKKAKKAKKANRKSNGFYYSRNDVEHTLKLVETIDYEKVTKIDENISMTFFKNGHMLGAAIILLQIHFEGCEDINLLFTGDYKKDNLLFKVPKIPLWVRKLKNVFLFQESTYGITKQKSVKKVFGKNVTKAIKEGKTVVAFVLAKERPFQVLNEILKLQQKGKIPKDIPIYLDGLSLQIFFAKYRELLNDSIPLPKNINFITPSDRALIMNESSSKIILPTSGIGSFGAAPIYIERYIEDSNALLQFNSYCAPNTFGAQLMNIEIGSTINFKINNTRNLKRFCDIKWTSQFSSHTKLEDNINFAKSFKHLNAVFVSHGGTQSRIDYANALNEELVSTDVFVESSQNVYRIFSDGTIKIFSSTNNLNTKSA